MEGLIGPGTRRSLRPTPAAKAIPLRLRQASLLRKASASLRSVMSCTTQHRFLVSVGDRSRSPRRPLAIRPSGGTYARPCRRLSLWSRGRYVLALVGDKVIDDHPGSSVVCPSNSWKARSIRGRGRRRRTGRCPPRSARPPPDGVLRSPQPLLRPLRSVMSARWPPPLTAGSFRVGADRIYATPGAVPYGEP